MHSILGSDIMCDKSARLHLVWSFSSVSQNSGLLSTESSLFLNGSLGRGGCRGLSRVGVGGFKLVSYESKLGSGPG